MQLAALAERTPPVILMVLEPAAAVMVCPVSVPLVQDGVDTVGGLATTRPSGRVSVKATPFKLPVLGLPMVNVSVL